MTLPIGQPDTARGSHGENTSGRLIVKAKQGDRGAISALFRRHRSVLQRWAHGRLPRWARNVSDTADLVQDALLQTFRKIDRFDDRGHGSLQAYLREAVSNRIKDELRRISRRPTDPWPDEFELPSGAPSPLETAVEAENAARYKAALARLSEGERLLIVGRLELGYSHEQLALVAGKATSDAARVALKRALLKLASQMANVQPID